MVITKYGSNKEHNAEKKKLKFMKKHSMDKKC